MGSIRDKLWSILGLGIGSLCLLLHVIALSLPEWVRIVVKKGKDGPSAMKTGLWQSCSIVPDDGCRTLPTDGPGLDDAFRCVQAFACIALVLLLVAVVVSILNVKKSENKLFPAILIGVHGVHGAVSVCLIIAFYVWSAEYLEDVEQEERAEEVVVEVKTGSSFGLEIVCFILELVAAVFMVLDFKSRSK